MSVVTRPEGPGAQEPQAPVPPLRRNRDFWFLWTGVGMATWGNTVSSVAYPLLLIWRGGSVTAAGIVGFTGLLPLLLLQLPAGVFVDRWDRRRTMMCCNVAGVVAMVVLLATLISGHLWVPLIAATAFVETTAMIFYRLSERAAVRNVVHPAHLPTALAQNQARGRASGLLGQPTGSSLFALSTWAPFVFTGFAHAVAVVNLMLIRKPFQSRRVQVKRKILAEVAEGLRWTFHQRFLRNAVLLVSVTNILFNALQLALVLIIKEHHGSPALMGVIGVLSGIGGITGTLVGGFFLRRFHPGTIIAGVFVVWTLMMPLIAVTSFAVLLGILMSVMLCAGALINVVAGVYQVQITPDHLQGRVGSVASLLSSGANSLGPLAAGFLLGSFGASGTVLWLSAVMLVVTVVALLNPALRAARLARPGELA